MVWTQVLAAVTAMLPILGIVVPLAVLLPALIVTGALEMGSMIALTLVMIPIVLAAIVFSIFLVIRFLVVMPVFVVEGIGGIGALRRSYRLVAGFGLKVWVIVIIAQLIVAILQWIVVMVPELVLSGAVRIIVSSLLDAVSSAVLVPVIAVAYVLIYFDLRIRKEGLDLEILAQDLERRKQRAEQEVLS